MWTVWGLFFGGIVTNTIMLRSVRRCGDLVCHYSSQGGVKFWKSICVNKPSRITRNLMNRLPSNIFKAVMSYVSPKCFENCICSTDRQSFLPNVVVLSLSWGKGKTLRYSTQWGSWVESPMLSRYEVFIYKFLPKTSIPHIPKSVYSYHFFFLHSSTLQELRRR